MYKGSFILIYTLILQHMPKTKTNTKKRKRYDTDLTDKEWAIIAPLIPPAKPGGRPRKVDIREVINAIFYLLKSGCTWRLLPHDFPQWKTVYYYFDQWKQDSTWKKIHNTIREQVRTKYYKKKKQPSAGIIDSQSVKTSKKGEFVAMTLVKK